MNETTAEVITIAEATTRYPGQWVVLLDPEVDEYGTPIRGQLVHHSEDRSEAHRHIGGHAGRTTAIFYTGELTGRYVL